MRIRYHFNRTEVGAFEDLLAFYGPGQLSSATCSTVPLLSLISKEDGVAALLTSLGLVRGDCDLYLEYQVPSPKGKGKRSHSDLVVRTQDKVVVMETKWTEPPYPTVLDWMTPPTENRKLVLNGWCELLQSRATGQISIEDINAITYQTIHRAASACSFRETAALIYLVFSPLPDGSNASTAPLLHNLRLLRCALGNDSLQLSVNVLNAITRPSFKALKEDVRMAIQVEDKNRLIRIAIAGTTLFDFGSTTVTSV